MPNDLNNHYNFALICPTFNAGEEWLSWIEALKLQKIDPERVLIIDSGSSDDTVSLSKENGFKVLEIPNSEFNHGSTRNLGADHFGDSVEVLIYLTQDAILANTNSIQQILTLFSNSEVAAVCGRQLPRKNAKPVEAHARIFNYPNLSRIKSKSDVNDLGIKVAFMSNSFAAYRKDAFYDCGKFPKDTIFAEDMSLAARMILNDYKVAYSSEAQVFHSHDYTLLEEFKRYFDVGVFYNRERWIKEKFGGAGGEGVKYVLSELKYLRKTKKIHLIPDSLIRNFLKFVAFKIGGFESHLPKALKRKISMNKRYWK